MTSWIMIAIGQAETRVTTPRTAVSTAKVRLALASGGTGIGDCFIPHRFGVPFTGRAGVARQFLAFRSLGLVSGVGLPSCRPVFFACIKNDFLYLGQDRSRRRVGGKTSFQRRKASIEKFELLTNLLQLRGGRRRRRRPDRPRRGCLRRRHRLARC